MSEQYYVKYRPKTWEEVLGNEAALESLQAIVADKSTHSFLITGPPGCGKTTVARLIAQELGCDLDWGFIEINGGNDRGIETIRGINTKSAFGPLAGNVQLYFIDEAHRLTKDGSEALLKLLEEPPNFLYFVLATSEPEKLTTALKQRCMTYTLGRVSDHELTRFLRKISKLEDLPADREVFERIVELAEGTPRYALVMLQQISVLDTSEKMLNVLNTQYEAPEADIRNLCQALLKGEWKPVREILATVKGDVQPFRRAILSYMEKVLLSNDVGTPRADRAARIMGEISNVSDYYGRPGLVFAAYMAVEQ